MSLEPEHMGNLFDSKQTNIEQTIQVAIDRAAEAWLDTEGTDIETAEPRERWQAYAALLDDMGRNWRDLYPLAEELAQLRVSTLQSLFHDITN